MAMYRPVLTDWMATTLRPTGIKLNRAARGKRRETRGSAASRRGRGQVIGWLAGVGRGVGEEGCLIWMEAGDWLEMGSFAN